MEPQNSSQPPQNAVATPTTTPGVTPVLSSIGVLFQASWQLFKQCWEKLLLLILLEIGIFVVFAVIAVALLGVSVFAGIVHGGAPNFNPATLISSGIVIGILYIAVVVAISIVSISELLVVAANGGMELGEALQKGFQLFLPVLWVSILSFFFIGGGTFFFLLPGILLAFYLMFASLEVVIENKRGMAALRHSALIVAQNFWGIVLRVIIFGIAAYILVLVAGSLSRHVGVVGVLISLFCNFLVSAYGTCFCVTLYNQARKGLENQEAASLPRVAIFSILGWIICILLMVCIIFLVTCAKSGKISSNTNDQFNTHTNYFLSVTPAD